MLIFEGVTKEYITQEIFLDGKVTNLVYITLVKLVPAQSGIFGFESIQQRNCCSFSIKEELIHGVRSCKGDFVLHTYLPLSVSQAQVR
jgi:hypothetical protein